MCSPSWTPLPPPSSSHPSGSSQCTSPEHPVPCIEPGLVICFTYDNVHAILHMDITRWSIPESHWLYSSQLKMEKLYIVSKNKQGVDCGSAHEPLIAKFRLKLKKVGKTTRPLFISMLFSQIIPPLPSPTESKRLFFTSVSLLLSHIRSSLPS